MWGCAGYFALKYSTRQRAGAEFMPITKLELAPHHGDFAGMCMLYHTHQKRGRAGLPGPRRKPCPIAHVTFMIYTAPFVGGGVPCQARMDAEKYCAFVGNYVVGRPSPAQKPPAAVGLRNAPAGAEPSGRWIGFVINPVEPYMTRSRNGQDRSLQNIA